VMRTNSIFIIPSTPSSMRGNMSSDRQCTGSGMEHGTRDVGGAGEASTRTTTKTKTFPGKGDVSRGAEGGITLGRSPNDNQPRRAGGEGVSHITGEGGVSWGTRGGRGEAGGRICPPRSRGGTRDGRGAGGPRIAHPCPGNAKREGRLYCEFFEVGKEWQGPRRPSHETSLSPYHRRHHRRRSSSLFFSPTST